MLHKNKGKIKISKFFPLYDTKRRFYSSKTRITDI